MAHIIFHIIELSGVSFDEDKNLNNSSERWDALTEHYGKRWGFDSENEFSRHSHTTPHTTVVVPISLKQKHRLRSKTAAASVILTTITVVFQAR